MSSSRVDRQSPAEQYATSCREHTLKVVDDKTTLLALLDDLGDLPAKPPSLYFDLEGVKLGRNGSISILTLYIYPAQKIFLIDIHILGETAFNTVNDKALSLRSIFESRTIPKVVFDIRNDSDALFNEYNIRVDGIKDLQLMELATRDGSQKLVAGLAKCIERDALLSLSTKQHWQRTKENGARLYLPAKGGSYEVFNQRPIRSEIQDYCAGDILMLPHLFEHYNTKLYSPRGGGAFWRVQVREETQKRIDSARDPNYDGAAESKIYGPWDQWKIEEAREAWNDEVMWNIQTGDFTLNEDDEWV